MVSQIAFCCLATADPMDFWPAEAMLVQRPEITGKKFTQSIASPNQIAEWCYVADNNMFANNVYGVNIFVMSKIVQNCYI